MFPAFTFLPDNMRYKISNNIHIVNAALYKPNDFKASLFESRYIIKDRIEDKEFLINDTIRLFIKKFEQPSTFEDLVYAVAKETNASEKVITSVAKPFFDYLLYRRFLVEENEKEKKYINRGRYNKGKKLGDFILENKIDTKPDLDIYRAKDKTGKPVLIKLLKSYKTKYKQRLTREYEILKRLNNTRATPHAMALVDTGTDFFYAQHFIEGQGISDYISTIIHSLKTITQSIQSIACAFSKIHRAGIIHGDVHTSNIIVVPDKTVKIIDFGLSVCPGSDKNELVKFGGVYFFMPPERIRVTTYKKFNRKPDFYSDVYQLGIVFYMLVYNLYPYNGLTWEELSANIKKGEAVFADQSFHGFNVPCHIKTFIQKCMAVKVTERFANAIEMHNAFTKIVRKHGFI